MNGAARKGRRWDRRAKLELSGGTASDKTGTKYHLQSCRTLRGRGIPIKLSESKRDGREACKICKPGT